MKKVWEKNERQRINTIIKLTLKVKEEIEVREKNETRRINSGKGDVKNSHMKKKTQGRKGRLIETEKMKI